MNAFFYTYAYCSMAFKSIWFWLQLIIFGVLTLLLWDKIIEKSSDGDNTIKSWFFALSIIVVSSLVIFNPLVLTDNTSYNYLLSAINQSLATLFAIVFTLMFILTQFSKSNKGTNYQVSKNFTSYVLIYVISFVIAIIAPLFLMGTKQALAIKIVLYMAVLNVAMLIPFFWRFKVTTTRKKWWL